MKIGTRISGGFLLLSLLALTSGLVGLYGVSRLKDTIDFISGPAWHTADGAMEASIAFEAQMLAVDRLLMNPDDNVASQDRAVAEEMAADRLERVASQGLISEADLQTVHADRNRFQRAEQAVLAASAADRTRTRALMSSLQTFEDLIELTHRGHHVGDTVQSNDTNHSGHGAVAEESGVGMEHDQHGTAAIENNHAETEHGGHGASAEDSGHGGPATDTDDDGEHTSTSLDTVENMVNEHLAAFRTQVALLKRLYFYRRWIDDEEDAQRGLDTSLAELQQAIDDPMWSRVDEQGHALSPALTSEFHKQKRGLAAAQEAHASYQQARVHYRSASAKLLQSIEVMEELGDSKVEGENINIRSTVKFSFGMIIAATMLCFLIAGVAGFLIVRAITRPLHQAVDVADKIAAGDLSSTIETQSSDEAGQLLQSLKAMQQNLQTSIAQDKLKAVELGRIKQALDNVSSKVMVTDSQHEIVYLNKSADRMFRESEAEICIDLERFNVETILGGNIDIFDNGSEHWQQLLTTNETHDGECAIGPRIFRTVTNTVTGNDGERIGTVVEWSDRTLEHAVEAEVETIVSAARSGDLSQRVDLEGKIGFYQILSSGINDMLSVCERVIDDVVRVLGAYAEGDFTQRIHANYDGAFGELKQHANTTAAKLDEITDSIMRAADNVSNGAAEISSGNFDLSNRTEEQAASLEETSSNMDEMTATVSANAEHAERANELASETRGQAEQGSVIVGKANAAMVEINQASKKIANIISVIDDIAFQTNLLALNAAVEAARAGDQGRGFAVVASEVRTLAQRSAKAAKEIKDLIEDSVAKVAQGSELVDNSGVTLDRIVESVTDVNRIIGEIASASREQSSGIRQVNESVRRMDEMTQQNAAMVEEVAAASQTMGEQAKDLHRLVSFFRMSGDSDGDEQQQLDDDHFKAAS